VKTAVLERPVASEIPRRFQGSAPTVLAELEEPVASESPGRTIRETIMEDQKLSFPLERGDLRLPIEFGGTKFLPVTVR
jgi:hypothetical protein